VIVCVTLFAVSDKPLSQRKVTSIAVSGDTVATAANGYDMQPTPDALSAKQDEIAELRCKSFFLTQPGQDLADRT
jgi:hypothetical protein